MSVTAHTREAARPPERHGHSFDFTPHANDRLARSLRWRNRWITIMAWVAGATLVGLVTTFLAYAGLFSASVPEVPEIADAEIVSDTLTMGDAHFTGFDKRNQAYAISAAAAEQDRDNPNVIYLETVRAELKLRRSGDVVLVSADSGIYDTDTEVLVLSSNIKVLTTHDLTAQLSTATVTLNDGYVTSDDPVTVISKDGTIVANGVRMWNNAQRILFTNRVRVIFEGDDGKADAG